MKRLMPLAWLLAAGTLVVPFGAPAYPIHGSEDSGIARLEAARLAQDGEKRLPGEGLALEQVDLRLLEHRDLELPPSDAAFTAEVIALLGADAERASVSLLDLSDLDAVAFAEYNGGEPRDPGGVGAIIVATGLFQTLADVYPGDQEKRRQVLRETMATADGFILGDERTVRLWDAGSRTLVRRPLQVGDRANLYSFLDWMLSAGSNAAAATLQKHTMLLAHFGEKYPIAAEVGATFFADSPKDELGKLLVEVMQAPLERSGLDPGQLRQGGLFTPGGRDKVPGTSSRATSRQLVEWLLRLEQGRIVDDFSSRDIKRLLYVTERRIHYADAPELAEAAVYFKSGARHACTPEPGFACRKYHGNQQNLMTSLAIVEAPAGAPRLFYLVALATDVLRENSALGHQALAGRIHRLIERRHGTTGASQ